MSTSEGITIDVERATLDYFESLAESNPAALQMLIIAAANELWSAVDEGRAEGAMLQSLRDHLYMLTKYGPQRARDQ